MGAVNVDAYLGYGVMVDWEDFVKPTWGNVDFMEYCKEFGLGDPYRMSVEYVKECWHDYLIDSEYVLGTDVYADCGNQKWFVGHVVAVTENEMTANFFNVIEMEETEEVKGIIKGFTGMDIEPRFCMFTRWS